MSSIPKEHKAALLPETKAKFIVGNVPTKLPKEDEVLVKVTATAINPVDWKIREWNIFIKEYPGIVGTDAAGEIVALGSNVKDLSVGDRVFFQGIISKNDHATFQQYTTIPADLVALTPENITDEQAAGISLASIAVVAAFYHPDGGVDLHPRPWEKDGDQAGKGKAVVILGGSSSVGQYAIQLARLSGFDAIITASSPAHHDTLKKLGATVVLDRNKASIQDYVDAATASKHAFAFVFDSISTDETMLQGVQILQKANPVGADNAKRSNLRAPTLTTVYTIVDSIKEAAQSGDQGRAEKIDTFNVWGIGSSPHLRQEAVAFMKAASKWLSTTQFIPNRPTVVPGGLQNLEQALEKNKAGVSGEKVVIRPFDS